MRTITVPAGQPGRLEELGFELGAMSGALEAASSRLRALPSALNTWAGPASVSFAHAAYAQADATAVASEAFAIAREAVRAYARELREARREAREAIEQAREATERIREAERMIDDARDRLAAAQARAAIAAAAGALDEQLAAQEQAQQADADLQAAVRRRDAAEEDLDRAHRRGDRAAEAAHDAERRVVGAYSAIVAMVPYVPALGAPAQGHAGGRAPTLPGADRFAPGGSAPAAAAAGFLSDEAGFMMLLTGGALTGIGARQLHRAAVRAERRYRTYNAWRRLDMTPDQEIRASQSRANAGRAAQAARSARFNPFRTLGAGAVVLEPVGAYTQFKANEAGGMGATENAVRTGASSAAALGVGFAGGIGCAMTGAGVLLAGACGAGGAYVGSVIGDAFGHGVYWAGDKAYTRVLEPGWEKTGGALLDWVGLTE
jgi:hypothetical protein